MATDVPTCAHSYGVRGLLLAACANENFDSVELRRPGLTALPSTALQARATRNYCVGVVVFRCVKKCRLPHACRPSADLNHEIFKLSISMPQCPKSVPVLLFFDVQLSCADKMSRRRCWFCSFAPAARLSSWTLGCSEGLGCDLLHVAQRLGAAA